MDPQARMYYEQRFTIQWLEAKGLAFQDLFASVMSKAHPGDFMPCRPWGAIGDRKNDGYLKSERTLFQVYAPNEMSQAVTLRKLVADFTAALPHWRAYFGGRGETEEEAGTKPCPGRQALRCCRENAGGP